MLTETATSIFYEAPRRILSTLSVLAELLPTGQSLVVAKEISKTFETYRYGSAKEVYTWFAAEDVRQKGEFVILISPGLAQDEALPMAAKDLLRLLYTEMPPKKASGVVATHYGLKKNTLYQWALENLS